MSDRPLRFFIVTPDGREWIHGETELYKVRALIATHRPKPPEVFRYYTMREDWQLHQMLEPETHLSLVSNVVCLPERYAAAFLSTTKYALVEWYAG